jgi:sugar phosphate isomerase/epimerase
MMLAVAWGAPAAGLSDKFYAFDNGTGRDQKLPFEEQAALLSRAGYAGMAIYTGTPRIPEMLAALDARSLELAGIYVHSYTDSRPEPIDPGIPQAVRQLAGRKTMLMLTVQGPNGPGAEERAVDNVRRVADLAAEQGLRVCLYPHIGFYVETLPDALRVIRKAGRANVGVALNLYHTVVFHLERCGGEDFDMARLIAGAGSRLWLVSVNGITVKQEGRAGLNRLDQGDYDLAPVLRLLDRAGYSGPVALQSYQVPGDTAENLARSMAAWRALLKRVRGAAAPAK